MMIISIASGKGGTGKTTVATNLFRISEGASLFDCDVEEPNCHLFMGQKMATERSVLIPKPVVDNEECIGCGKCSKFCRYNALFNGKDGVLVFDKICHGCGGCAITCPVNAISEVGRRIGEIRSAEGVELMDGLLDISYPSGVPIIKELRSLIREDGLTLIDSPPGTSCSAVESIRDSDACILVTEPTPFGAHDLKAAIDVASDLGIPIGVVINRDGIGDSSVQDIIREVGIPLLGSIPNDIMIARVYSEGRMIVDELPEYRKVFEDILENAKGLVGN